MRVENGLLITKLYIDNSKIESIEGDWEFVNFCLEMSEIYSFMDMDFDGQETILKNTVKVFTVTQDTLILQIPYQKFLEIYLKYKNSISKNIFTN